MLSHRKAIFGRAIDCEADDRNLTQSWQLFQIGKVNRVYVASEE